MRAGFNPQNPLDFAQNGFGFRPISTTEIIYSVICLARGFALLGEAWRKSEPEILNCKEF